MTQITQHWLSLKQLTFMLSSTARHSSTSNSAQGIVGPSFFWSVAGLMLDICGGFLLAVEAIKLENISQAARTIPEEPSN